MAMQIRTLDQRAGKRASMIVRALSSRCPHIVLLAWLILPVGDGSAQTVQRPTGASMPSQRTDTARPTFVTPLIDGFGAIAPLPQSTQQPRPHSKVVYDITGENGADHLIKGLENVALLFNLAAEAGIKPDQLKVAAVLHGPATRAALRQDAYAKHTGSVRNPNVELIRRLTDLGVELYVCGQALAHQRYGLDEVLPEVQIAAAASTVNINKQMEGYAYLAVR